MSSMKPIDRRPVTLADTAYQRISDALLAGTIEPGARLVMDQLAKELDISRTPVRDALLRLQREGMIEPSGRRGYVVRAVGVHDSVHLYEARESVECFAARRAAELGTSAVEHVRAAVEAARGTDLTDVRAVYEANLAIHRSFVEVLGNPVMLDLFDVVWQGARGRAMFSDYLAHASEREDIAAAHEPLVEALQAGPDASEKAMCAHIAAGRRIHES
jgi:DNA-binding GntR family transcriptional regulator